MSESVITILWSEILGALAVGLIKDEFVVNTRSSRFSSRVGLS